MNLYKTIFCIILILIILFSLFTQNPKTNFKHKYHNAIKTLVRQAARWTTASLQDENAMIAVLHANYGAGYLWALQDIAESSEIEKTARINFQKFRNSIVSAQDIATKKMVQMCPDFGPTPSYLTKIAGEE